MFGRASPSSTSLRGLRRARLGSLAAAACSLALAACYQFANVGGADVDAGGDPIERDGGRTLDPDAVAPPVDAGSPADAADAGDARAPCPSEIAMCNPIVNTGCPGALGMQCAADLFAQTLAGYCTFNAPVMGLTCLNTGVTESCPPTTACFGTECRKLCLCDADCPQALCCTTVLSESGFKVCGACP